MDLSWVKDVERQLRVLAQRTAHLPTRVRGGGGGGGGGLEYYEEPSEASLPNDASVGSKAFARTSVDPPGGFFVRNETGDGWFCLTHWR